MASLATGWPGPPPLISFLPVTCLALFHDLFLFELPLGLQFFDAPDTLGKQGMAYVTIA